MRNSSLSREALVEGTVMMKTKQSNQAKRKTAMVECMMVTKKGPWTAEEDQLLTNCINREGEGRWRTLPKRAGLQRCGKSCRLRWMNYLRPSVKRGHIAPDEEDLILRLHRLLGNRWSLIAGRIPGRTDNDIKNYWNTHLSKKLLRQGIDPRTHKALFQPPSTTTSTATSNTTYRDNHHDNVVHDHSKAPLPLSNETEKEEDDNNHNTNCLSSVDATAVNNDYNYALCEEYQDHLSMSNAIHHPIGDHHQVPETDTRSDSTGINQAILMSPTYHDHHHLGIDDHMSLHFIDHDHHQVDDVFSTFLNSLLIDDIDMFPSDLSNSLLHSNNTLLHDPLRDDPDIGSPPPTKSS